MISITIQLRGISRQAALPHRHDCIIELDKKMTHRIETSVLHRQRIVIGPFLRRALNGLVNAVKVRIYIILRLINLAERHINKVVRRNLLQAVGAWHLRRYPHTLIRLGRQCLLPLYCPPRNVKVILIDIRSVSIIERRPSTHQHSRSQLYPAERDLISRHLSVYNRKMRNSCS